MPPRNNKYVYGSTAEKIKQEQLQNPNLPDYRDGYDPYEQNSVLKSKKIARNNAKLKKRIMVNMFLIFSMCAVIMLRYAQISQMNYDNNKLSKEYTSIQNENTRLSLEIEKAMSLQSIRDIAENELSMHKPEKSQIVYISVPKKDVIIFAAKEEGFVFSLIKEIENGARKLLNIF